MICCKSETSLLANAILYPYFQMLLNLSLLMILQGPNI